MTTSPEPLSSATRTLRLLRLVGAHDAEGGVRLTDLIAATGYDKSTTHRALKSLVAEGFVSRAADRKRYRLGIEASRLALAAIDHGAVKALLRPVLMRVARKTRDVAYLMLRTGPNAVCLLREEGAFPVKTLLADVGVVRPLGLSTVGVSILAGCRDEEVERAFDANAREYRLRGVERELLMQLVRATRATGYSEMSFLSDQVGGVGQAIRLSATIQAGIGVVAVSARMDAVRRREVGAMLREELLPLERSAGP